MVWGSFHPGIVLLQVEEMVARKVFSTVTVLQEQRGETIYRDNQYLSRVSSMSFAGPTPPAPDHNPYLTVEVSLILSTPYVLRCHTDDFARVISGNGLENHLSIRRTPICP